MESIKKNRLKTYLLLASCTLLAICSVFFPILLIVVPGLTAAAIAKSEKASYAITLTALIPIITLLVIYGAGIELLCVLPLLLSAVGAGIMIYALQKKKYSGFETVFYTALLLGGMFYLSITLPSLLSGKEAFTIVKEAAAAIKENLKQQLAALPEASSLITGFPQFTTILESLPELIVMCIVPYCCLIGGSLSFSNLLFFRLFIKKHREELGYAPLRRFSAWSVPRSYIFGSVILFFGSLALDLMESESADAVTLVGITLFSLPMTVQGLCCIDWLIEKRGKKEKLLRTRILVYVAIALFSRFTITSLLLIGTVEQLFRIRERVIIITHSGNSGPRSPFTRRTSDLNDKAPDDDPEKNQTEKK